MSKIISYLDYVSNDERANGPKRLLYLGIIVTGLVSFKDKVKKGVTVSVISCPWPVQIGNSENTYFSEFEINEFLKVVYGYGMMYFNKNGTFPDVTKLLELFKDDTFFPTNEILNATNIHKFYLGKLDGIDLKEEAAKHVII